MKVKTFTIGAALALMVAGGASAETFDWSYTDGTVSGRGQLTTGAADAANLAGGFDVTAFTGVLTGSAPGVGTITSLAGINPPGFSTDNVVAPFAAQGAILDIYGIGFDVGGNVWNFWGNGLGTPDSAYTYAGYDGRGLGTFTISAPEPVAWALMLIGVGSVGVALRSRRKAIAAV
jgi:hypothetical protein